MELEFHAIFFKQLDFRQIEFQNRSISLNNFRNWAFDGTFWRKEYISISSNFLIIKKCIF